MPHVKVYIHFVWSKKDRVPYLLTKDIREALWKHILENARLKGIFIDFVNGYTDHCHCLVSLGADQTMSKIVQLIKGESAIWFNKQEFITHKFSWQEEYFAVSVSESALHKVREYIKNQEEHHGKKSFKEEYEELIDFYGFRKFKDE